VRDEEDAVLETLDLRGCPFCGAKPAAAPVRGDNPARTSIHCDNDRCDAAPTVVGKTARLAQASWNRREATRLYRVTVGE
jgi:hypothetical protein